MSGRGFDVLIHAPNRLQICAFLSTFKEVEFKLLRERLDVSDSVLSKHISALEEAKYVTLAKRTENGRQRTWVALSKEGVRAFNAHVNALKEIIGE